MSERPESHAPVRLPANLRNVQYEEVGSTTYIGWAAPGTANSDPAWRIMRIVYSGSNFTITHADGNVEFDNVWDARAVMDYS
jgi:hypothetical protein